MTFFNFSYTIHTYNIFFRFRILFFFIHVSSLSALVLFLAVSNTGSNEDKYGTWHADWFCCRLYSDQEVAECGCYWHLLKECENYFHHLLGRIPYDLTVESGGSSTVSELWSSTPGHLVYRLSTFWRKLLKINGTQWWNWYNWVT